MSPERLPAFEAVLEGFVVNELRGDGDPAAILPDERPLVARAVDSRVRQFAAGRQCARAGLAAVGAAPTAIVRADGRAPRWPVGVGGSISHTDGYAIAAVATTGPDRASVGVDAEVVGRVGEQLFERLFVERERQWLAALPAPERAGAATELFGLKECYYKAQFPLTGAWVGFHDVLITPETTGATTGVPVGARGVRGPGGDEGAAEAAGPLRRWRLEPLTDLAALAAVRWPVVGWSWRRPVAGGEVAVTAVAAHAAGDTSGGVSGE
ncbi:MAG: 4'-phosphopantetheinyl transferase superfamily protein [Actinomycetota bacterium]